MGQLPTLNMRAEREQLAQLMSQPIARRRDYKQTKQSIDLFVQAVKEPKYIGGLVDVKAG